MKKIAGSNFFKSFIVLAFIFSFSGCGDTSYEEITYMANVPVYMSLEDLRTSVKITGPKELKHPGKIYFKANYLYINELYRGIHIIDNTNPSSPQKVAFIYIPGNVDIAMKGNILYADSYIDLIAIDISDLSNITVTKRVNAVFEYSYPPAYNEFVIAEIDNSKGVVIGWEVKSITERVDVNNGWYSGGRMDASESVLTFQGGQRNAFTPNAVGISGSMARFATSQSYNYLYAINQGDIKVFNISNFSDPVEGGTVNTSRVIETLFLLEDKLFVGSTTGMLIFSLNTPSNPIEIATFNHFRSCDPVVVEGNYAYVTLRAGNRCGGFQNQLDVIDISTITNPQLLKSYEMEEPYGLGIDDGTLFICDGDAGLKIYDAADPFRIDENIITSYPDINSFDVIPYNNVLMMIGSDGIYQYDYQNLENIKELSVIKITP